MSKKSPAKVPAAPTNSAVNAQIVLSSIEEEAAPLLKKIKRITAITNAKELDAAAQVVKTLKGLAAIADKKEKGITQPLEQAKKMTIALFKPFKRSVSEAEESIKSLILDYHLQQDKKVQKLEEDFQVGKIKKVETFTRKNLGLQVVSTASNVRKVWKLAVVDAAKVPREFLIPDESAIEEHYRNGGKPIAGTEWKQEKSISI